MSQDPGRVLALQVENFKGIRAVELAFAEDESLVVLSGANDQGKSSVIEALAAAVGGERLCPAEPIRRGESEAQAVVTLENYIVTRRWWKNSKSGSVETDLRVTGADGARFPSPQALLDSFLGDLTFDPLKFMGLKDADQRDRLLELTGLGDRLAKLDAARDSAFAERTEVNREVKRLRGALETEYAGLPAERPEVPDTSAIAARQRENAEAREAHANLRRAAEDARERHEAAVRHVGSIQAQIRDLQEALTKAEEKRAALEALVVNSEAAVEASPNPPLLDVSYELEAATLAKERADAFDRRAKARLELAEAEGASSALTEKLDGIKGRKAALLAKADFPVPGLAFGEDGLVRFEGVPLAQCSSSQQLRVSMAVGMRANPALRLMLVDEGERLDASRKALVRELASAEGYQVLMTMVDESGAVGVVIEDGAVKA